MRWAEEKRGAEREGEPEEEEASQRGLVFLWLEAEFGDDGERSSAPKAGRIGRGA